MKSKVPDVGDLPSYLGFGFLDKGSVQFSAGRLQATYTDPWKERAHKVAWDRERCVPESYFEGRIMASSSGPNLELALRSSFSEIERPDEDPRFRQLADRVTAQGNIFFRFPPPRSEAMGMRLFYPAGLILVLQQPILESNRRAWEAMQARLNRDYLELPFLDPPTESPGVLLRLYRNGDLRTERLTVADFKTTILLGAHAAQICAASGIIPPQKRYRLVVMQSADAEPGNLWVHPGVPDEEEIGFTIMPDYVTTEREAAVDQFVEMAWRMFGDRAHWRN